MSKPKPIGQFASGMIFGQISSVGEYTGAPGESFLENLAPDQALLFAGGRTQGKHVTTYEDTWFASIAAGPAGSPVTCFGAPLECDRDAGPPGICGSMLSYPNYAAIPLDRSDVAGGAAKPMVLGLQGKSQQLSPALSNFADLPGFATCSAMGQAAYSMQSEGAVPLLNSEYCGALTRDASGVPDYPPATGCPAPSWFFNSTLIAYVQSADKGPRQIIGFGEVGCGGIDGNVGKIPYSISMPAGPVVSIAPQIVFVPYDTINSLGHSIFVMDDSGNVFRAEPPPPAGSSPAPSKTAPAASIDLCTYNSYKVHNGPKDGLGNAKPVYLTHGSVLSWSGMGDGVSGAIFKSAEGMAGAPASETTNTFLFMADSSGNIWSCSVQTELPPGLATSSPIAPLVAPLQRVLSVTSYAPVPGSEGAPRPEWDCGWRVTPQKNQDGRDEARWIGMFGITCSRTQLKQKPVYEYWATRANWGDDDDDFNPSRYPRDDPQELYASMCDGRWNNTVWNSRPPPDKDTGHLQIPVNSKAPWCASGAELENQWAGMRVPKPQLKWKGDYSNAKGGLGRGCREDEVADVTCLPNTAAATCNCNVARPNSKPLPQPGGGDGILEANGNVAVPFKVKACPKTCGLSNPDNCFCGYALGGGRISGFWTYPGPTNECVASSGLGFASKPTTENYPILYFAEGGPDDKLNAKWESGYQGYGDHVPGAIGIDRSGKATGVSYLGGPKSPGLNGMVPGSIHLRYLGASKCFLPDQDQITGGSGKQGVGVLSTASAVVDPSQSGYHPPGTLLDVRFTPTPPVSAALLAVSYSPDHSVSIVWMDPISGAAHVPLELTPSLGAAEAIIKISTVGNGPMFKQNGIGVPPSFSQYLAGTVLAAGWGEDEAVPGAAAGGAGKTIMYIWSKDPASKGTEPNCITMSAIAVCAPHIDTSFNADPNDVDAFNGAKTKTDALDLTAWTDTSGKRPFNATSAAGIAIGSALQGIVIPWDGVHNPSSVVVTYDPPLLPSSYATFSPSPTESTWFVAWLNSEDKTAAPVASDNGKYALLQFNDIFKETDSKNFPLGPGGGTACIDLPSDFPPPSSGTAGVGQYIPAPTLQYANGCIFIIAADRSGYSVYDLHRENAGVVVPTFQKFSDGSRFCAL